MPLKGLAIAPQPFFSPRGTPFSVYYRTLVTAELGAELDLLTYGEGQDVDIPGVRIIRIPRFGFLGPIKIGPSVAKLFLDVFIVLWTRRAPDPPPLRLRPRPRGERVLRSASSSRLFGFKLIYDMHSSLPEQLTQLPLHHLARADRHLRVAGGGPASRRADAVITICPELAAYAEPRMPDPSRHLLIENSIFDPVRLKRHAARRRAAGRAGRAARGPADRRLCRHVRGLPGPRHADRGASPRRATRCPQAFLVLVGGSAEQVEKYRARWPREAGIAAGDVAFTGRVDQAAAKAYMAARRDPGLAAQHRHQHAAQDLRAAGERHAAGGDAHPVAHPGARRRRSASWSSRRRRPWPRASSRALTDEGGAARGDRGRPRPLPRALLAAGLRGEDAARCSSSSATTARGGSRRRGRRRRRAGSDGGDPSRPGRDPRRRGGARARLGPELEAVRAYWQDHVTDWPIARAAPGSLEFFRETEAYRFEKLDYLERVVDYAGHAGRATCSTSAAASATTPRASPVAARGSPASTSRRTRSGSRRRTSASAGSPGRFLVMDGEAMAFPDASFDFVYCHTVLHFTPHPERMTAEIHRVLRPGGSAILMMVNRDSWMRRHAQGDEGRDRPPRLAGVPLVRAERSSAPCSPPSPRSRSGVERFPVRTRVHGGLKARVYNLAVVDALQRAAAAADGADRAPHAGLRAEGAA